MILLFLGCAQIQNNEIQTSRNAAKIDEIRRELDPAAVKVRLNEATDDVAVLKSLVKEQQASLKELQDKCEKMERELSKLKDKRK